MAYGQPVPLEVLQPVLHLFPFKLHNFGQFGHGHSGAALIQLLCNPIMLLRHRNLRHRGRLPPRRAAPRWNRLVLADVPPAIQANIVDGRGAVDALGILQWGAALAEQDWPSLTRALTPRRREWSRLHHLMVASPLDLHSELLNRPDESEPVAVLAAKQSGRVRADAFAFGSQGSTSFRRSQTALHQSARFPRQGHIWTEATDTRRGRLRVAVSSSHTGHEHLATVKQCVVARPRLIAVGTACARRCRRVRLPRRGLARRLIHAKRDVFIRVCRGRTNQSEGQHGRHEANYLHNYQLSTFILMPG